MENQITQSSFGPATLTKTKNSTGVIIFLSFLILISFGATVYLYLQNQQLSRQIESLQTVPTPANVQVQDPSTDWNTYTNEKFGLSFQYPQGAKITSKDPDPFPVVVQVDNLKPRTGGGGGPEFEGWVLSISETQPNPKNISLRQWAKDHKLISDISIANEVGSTETLPVDMYIDSLPVIKWTATGGDASNDLYLVKRPTGVIFIMVHDNFGRDIDTTDKILSTFKFTN